MEISHCNIDYTFYFNFFSFTTCKSKLLFVHTHLKKNTQPFINFFSKLNKLIFTILKISEKYDPFK